MRTTLNLDDDLLWPASESTGQTGKAALVRLSTAADRLGAADVEG